VASNMTGPRESVRFNPGSLRRLRKQVGLTQEALASKAGISVLSVRRAEGREAVSEDTAAAICHALGVDYRDHTTETDVVRLFGLVIHAHQVDTLSFAALGFVEILLIVVQENLNRLRR
jgi:transcriptional regulator with XRE-family HTH domain